MQRCKAWKVFVNASAMTWHTAMAQLTPGCHCPSTVAFTAVTNDWPGSLPQDGTIRL
jgi:hypothetical protein